jgi:hypothetical protein
VSVARDTSRRGSSDAGTRTALRELLATEDQAKEKTMGDLLKGGILWLLGVPIVLVVVLFMTGIL